MRASAVCFAILAAITQAVTFILLFIPGTLAVVPALPHTKTLTVPSIDFNGINPMKSASFHYARTDILKGNSNITTLKFIEPSQKWRQLILQAASSHTAPSWDPPAACGFACSYSFSYLAPALNCTELSKLDIWPSGSNTSDSRLGFPLHHHHATQDLSNSPRYYFYNSTVGISSDEPSLPNITFPTLDIIYIPYFNSMQTALFQNDPETTRKAWSPRGVHCTFENATYEATAEFLNNTQRLNTRVNKWHGPLSLGPLPNLVYAGMDSTNMTMASYSIVRSFSEILQGQMFYTPRLMQFNTSDTQALYTPLFNLTSYPANTPDLEEEANLVLTTFSPSPSFGEDLSTGLRSLLGNVTLAFVNEQMATTNVAATVTPNSTRYQYISWKLCLVYGIVFGLSFWISVYGLFCLQKNGTLAVFDVQHILEMTVESTRMQESVGNPKVGFALVNRPLLSVRTPR
ncbi:hypothetical protein D9757_004519 [Collybiopsis confluens]|uniref:Uncharacterized protein n=1 Tax=Collybiopsis confluens TaxID=2823264 RepID=A0A8H5ME98_9AGAR|nr:hypothetical protein D9757_004519 [Collybiopsis confluens]